MAPSRTWEMELLSARKVRDMIDFMPGTTAKPFWPSSRRAQAKWPRRRTDLDLAAGRRTSDYQFESWIFYGTVDADDLVEIGFDTEDEAPKAHDGGHHQ